MRTVRVPNTKMRAGLLDGESQLLDADRSFTRHPIDDPGQGIVVKLGVPAIINTVRCAYCVHCLLCSPHTVQFSDLDYN